MNRMKLQRGVEVVVGDDYWTVLSADGGVVWVVNNEDLWTHETDMTSGSVKSIVKDGDTFYYRLVDIEELVFKRS